MMSRKFGIATPEFGTWSNSEGGGAAGSCLNKHSQGRQSNPLHLAPSVGTPSYHNGMLLGVRCAGSDATRSLPRRFARSRMAFRFQHDEKKPRQERSPRKSYAVDTSKPISTGFHGQGDGEAPPTRESEINSEGTVPFHESSTRRRFRVEASGSRQAETGIPFPSARGMDKRHASVSLVLTGNHSTGLAA